MFQCNRSVINLPLFSCFAPFGRGLFVCLSISVSCGNYHQSAGPFDYSRPTSRPSSYPLLAACHNKPWIVHASKWAPHAFLATRANEQVKKRQHQQWQRKQNKHHTSSSSSWCSPLLPLVLKNLLKVNVDYFTVEPSHTSHYYRIYLPDLTKARSDSVYRVHNVFKHVRNHGNTGAAR